MTALLDLRWPALPAGVRAAFTLRGREQADGNAGVSAGPFSAFNLATHVGDLADAVAANRTQLRAKLRLPGEPIWLQQVHGSKVVEIDENTRLADVERTQADAIVSLRPGVTCAIQVADCLPVLFAAVDGSQIAAAHAGWRGLAGGILEATLAALKVAPDRLAAWIGPGICQRHFEVGEDVRQAFAAVPRADEAFVPNERGRWQCDLAQLAQRRLREAGCRSVATSADCTYCDSERFYSYRRDGRCGRMAALIWVETERRTDLKGGRPP